MTNLEAAKKLDEFFSDESKWTKGNFAKNKNGVSTNTRANDAVCWCLRGACFKLDLNTEVLDEPGIFFSIVTFNDAPRTTFAHIKDFLQKVIKYWEQKENDQIPPVS